uniref:Uncharacterized protein n=1 Tax=Panagrolaimus sp. JU765 TaxID=591449 RepID=A0AC34Q4T4_9BILA
MEIARLLEVETDLNGKLTKADDNGNMMVEEIRQLKAEIMKLKKELETHQLTFNDALEGNNTVTQQYQQLKEKNDENEQIINNLQMDIAQLLEVEMDLNDKLMKANDNQKMMSKTIKIEASKKLAKWTEAMKMKEPYVKPEQKEAYDHALECLKFMTIKHGSTLNTSELTTDVQQLTKQEFTDAIDNFVEISENSEKLLQKCKDIVDILESNDEFRFQIIVKNH